MVIEASLSRDLHDDLNKFIQEIINSGKEQIREFVIQTTEDDDF